MKPFTLLILLVVLLLAGCNGAPEQPTATQIPPPPTAAATAELELPTPLPPEATTVADEPTPTGEALATVAPSPTTEPATEPATSPTAAEAASPTPAATATAAQSPTPPTTPGLFGPGQVDMRTLAAGDAHAYVVQGTRFQPIILFVEPENQLNVALTVYSGDVSGQATPEGVTPLNSADNALAGRPEILVLSPDADGLFTFVVRAIGGEGSYTAHLYDLTTPAPGMAVQQTDTLAAGEEKLYTVTSRGARPIIAVADPTDQSDIALDFLGADGAVLTTANFGGPGGAETAYVLPLGAASYSIKIREVNGGPSTFQIAIVTLE